MSSQSVQEEAARIRQAWADLKAEDPKVKPKDGADKLGVSEGALLASLCDGKDVVRLKGSSWAELLEALPSLGNSMALTRNDSAVIERLSDFTGGVKIEDGICTIQKEELEIKLALDHLHHAFSNAVYTPVGSLRSIQFFDADGIAIHKIYVMPEGDIEAYDQFVAQFKSDDQTPGIAIESVKQSAFEFEKSLSEGETDRVVSKASLRNALDGAASSGVTFRAQVGNKGCVQTREGSVETVNEQGPFYNVDDKTFHLHIREDHIGSAKATKSDARASLEVLDNDGNCYARLFGPIDGAAWENVIDNLS